jgi:hypothetical protein
MEKRFLKKIVLVTAGLFTFGTPVFAQSKINKILTSITGTFDLVVGILFFIATIVFFWGIIRYIASGGDEKAKLNARHLISWGIIGLTLMVAAWGIVQILIQFLDIPIAGPTLGY